MQRSQLTWCCMPGPKLATRVNGPENAVVSETIKILLLDKIYTIARCFQGRCVGQIDAPDSWKIVKLFFSAKIRCRTKDGDQE